jgi:Cu+-exporting ATPase
LAGVTAVVWWQIDPVQALPVTVAVLVVSCPCALSLATPVALTIASGRLAREGLLVTRGHAVETLAQVTDVVLDKTGTLTTGKMRLIQLELMSTIDRDKCLMVAASLEKSSSHPLAQAIVHASGDQPLYTVSEALHETGAGIEAWIADQRYRIGHADYVAGIAGGLPPVTGMLPEETGTVLYLGTTGVFLARFVISDELRQDAALAVRELMNMNCQVSLLSGDGAATVRRIADSAGIQLATGRATPQSKLATVGALQADGKVVCMVGDGVNDAPALAAADVGVAMGAGSDVAIESAGVTLLKGDLQGLVKARRLSRAVMRNIRQNLFFAFVYNVAGIPIAAGLLYPGFGLLLSPAMAAAAMSLSSVSVVGNALRLRGARL